MPPALSALSTAELETLLTDWGEPAYRARQVFRAIHAQGRLSTEGMTNLPLAETMGW